MKKKSRRSAFLITSGARVQFAIGVALVSVIPLLTVWYLNMAMDTGGIPQDGRTVAVLILLVTLAISGYSILRKYPVNIVKLRGYLEAMIRGELPDQINLLQTEDDIRAVEDCLNVILKQLRERLENLQAEKKDLQEQLYQVQKTESLGVMAAGVAHDFNNILMGILTRIELMGDDLPEDSSLRQGVADIEELVHNAAELTNQMMLYSGRGNFEMESVDLSLVITDMAKLLNASVKDRAKLEYDLPEKLPHVIADSAQIRQVVMNLVINGADAIGEDKDGRIFTSTQLLLEPPDDIANCFVGGPLPAGETICVEVRDNGCGMEREKINRIFDPFYTTKRHGKGLGLAVVLGIVKAHKGAMLVDSVPGEGTRFRALIPVADTVAMMG